jgi:hypothetical protein
MKFLYNDLTNKLIEAMGIPKWFVEETFNKPDVAEIMSSKCISMKNFGEFYMLVILEIDERNDVVRFISAYKVFPKLLDGVNIPKTKPVDVLKELMNRYGIVWNVPKFGPQKFMIERSQNVFFPGILDIEKYMEAAKSV